MRAEQKSSVRPARTLMRTRPWEEFLNALVDTRKLGSVMFYRVKFPTTTHIRC